MKARSVTEFLRDVQASKAAQRDYRAAAARLSDMASLMKDVGDREHAREFSQFAFLAANAARAEFFDPEPGE